MHPNAPNYVAGIPGVSGCIRTQPEDFQVVEELGFEPAGYGEHVFLRVRKRAANTEWVARRIAAFAGVHPSAVSYAGLKDRHAVAEQWFSVHLPGKPDPDWTACREESFTVLDHKRHSRKLKRGALKGNAFRIVIRHLQGERNELEERLHRIEADGVPNYFGEQRFGHDGGNLNKAEGMFSGQEPVQNRHQRSLYLSAARAQVFNQVVSRRVAEGTWNRALAGDVMMLAGSHSLFPVAVVDDDIRRRAAAMDIHPTGPLWGAGELPSRGEVLALEQGVAHEFPVFCQGLEQARLEQERRPLRIAVADINLEFQEDHNVLLSFKLSAGAYATAVLRELISSALPLT